MENYTKGDNVSFAEDTKEDVLTELRQVLSEQIHSDFKVISVKPGSKLRNLTPAAINQFKTQGLTVLIGSGVAVSKVAAFGELVHLNFVLQNFKGLLLNLFSVAQKAKFCHTVE